MPKTFATALTVLVVAATLPANAQTPARHSSPPPTAPAPAPKPRIGYAADPAPAPSPVQVAAPTYYYPPGEYVVSGAPYQVLTDGSVLVNFGNGYERVLRSCTQSTDNSVQVNQTGRDALGRILPPPGIAALQAGTRGQAIGNTPARNANACYRHDARGRVEMMTTR
ncbi:MAG: hypothetical protein ABI625_07640 [bacterium]